MLKKSRKRGSQVKRLPETPDRKTVPIAHATHKPWQIAAVCAVLAVVTVFAYWGARSSDFVVVDDYGCVLQNPQLQQGVNLQSIAWAFTTHHCANWHPLTWISHMLDWSLYGRNPSGHHMTNVYLHAANAVLLFLLLLYMTGFLGRSAMVAFLFALHPAHVESVAWIIERKDVLCAFFWFTTIFAYAWYLRKPSWKRYIWIVFSFACALMSKPMAVTLPFTLLLLDYWPLHRVTFAPEKRAPQLSALGKLCVEKWPLFLMAILSSIITVLAQRAGGALTTFQHLPLPERICNAAISYCRYMRIMFWPDPLRIWYYYDPYHIMVSAAVLSILALSLITAVCWHFRKDRPYCLIGWMWFLGTLVPVIAIMQVGEQAMAERYTYLPLIGLFIAIVWLIGDSVANSPKIRIVTQLLAVAVIVACAVKTDAQVKVWQDNVTLFSHVLAIDPRGGLPNASLGTAYAILGRTAEAQEYFERALVYKHSDPVVLSYAAFTMIEVAAQTHDLRNLPLAEQRLDEALRIDPDNPEVLTVAADAHLYLANALLAQDKLGEAAQEYRQVLAIAPGNYNAHTKLGIILVKQGLTEEALRELRISLAFKPDQAIAHSEIGSILSEKHQYPEAVEEFTQTLRFDPSNAYAHNDLGVALFLSGDYEKAAEQFGNALQIDPNYSDARRNLGYAQSKIKNK